MKKLICVVFVTILFVGVEIVGGIYANSIAIMSDAAHLTSDALGIGISIVALKIAEKDGNSQYSSGYHRAEIIGAIISILFIWAISIWLCVEATKRFWSDEKVDGKTMLEVSGLCLIFNLIQMSILHSKDLHDHAHGPGQSCGHDHGPGGHDHAHDHGEGGCDHDHDSNKTEHSHDGKKCTGDHSAKEAPKAEHYHADGKKCSGDHAPKQIE